MMIYLLLAVGLLGVSFPTASSKTLNSGCPKIPTVPNFNITAYLGRWFLQARYKDPMFDNIICVTSDYTSNGQDAISITNDGINNKTGNRKDMTAIARVPDPNDASKLKITFPKIPAIKETDFWILDTDYKTYGIVYTCTPTGKNSRQRAWILTRERHPSEDTIRTAMKSAVEHTLEESCFILSNPAECGK